MSTNERTNEHLGRMVDESNTSNTSMVAERTNRNDEQAVEWSPRTNKKNNRLESMPQSTNVASSRVLRHAAACFTSQSPRLTPATAMNEFHSRQYANAQDVPAREVFGVSPTRDRLPASPESAVTVSARRDPPYRTPAFTEAECTVMSMLAAIRLSECARHTPCVVNVATLTGVGVCVKCV